MVITAAARQPKAIICQKPMAVDLGEADEMLTACERNGVKLLITYQRPHHATWLKARELLRQGVVGQVTQIHGGRGELRWTGYGNMFRWTIKDDDNNHSMAQG